MIDDLTKQEWAEALREARWAQTEESDARFSELVEYAAGTQDPFVIQALVATFHDRCMGDGIDEQVYTILHELRPGLWIAAFLADLPRLSREAHDALECLLAFSARTPDSLILAAREAGEATTAQVIGLMEAMAREDERRGTPSHIREVVENLKAATARSN